MNYRLKIGQGLGLSNVDLFPNQELKVDLDFYNVTDPSSIKIPFSFSEKIPFTETNKQILGYTGTGSGGYRTFSLNNFNYELYADSQLISRGKLKINSVVLNSTEPYFSLEMIDSVSNFANALKDFTFSDIYDDTFSTTIRTLSTYLNANQNYGNRPIEIPFIDFDNIQNKEGYPKRQLTSYGLDGDRFGLMPSINVTDFVKRCIEKAGFDYSSRFIDGDYLDSNDLYMMIPSYLSTSPADGRDSRLFPFPYNVEVNDNVDVGPITIGLTTYNNDPIKNYQINGEYGTFGPTNYNVVDTNVEYDYGNLFRTADGVTSGNPDNIGYIGYGSGFNAKFLWHTGANFVTIPNLKVAIPVVNWKINETDVPLVPSITNIGETVKFTPYIYIYKSFVPNDAPLYSIPLKDSSNFDLKLTPSSVLISNGTTDGAPGTYDIDTYNILSFSSFNAYIDSDVAYFLQGGTRYHVAFGVKIVEGSMEADLYSSNLGELPQTAFVAVSGAFIGAKEVAKQRTFNYDWSAVGLKVTNHSTLPATCPSDVFTFSDSLNNNDKIKVYDLFIDIMKRFCLSMVYDYTQATPTIIIDNVKDIRDTSAYIAIDQYVDNLKEFEVISQSDSPKTISIENEKNGGIFDQFITKRTVGDYNGPFSEDGVGELKIKFDSALINPIDKSICGESVSNDTILSDAGIVSVNEIGLTSNEILPYQSLGLRVFYLKSIAEKTTVRYPVFRRNNKYGKRVDQNIYYAVGTFNMQGITTNTSGLNDLRYGDKDNNPMPMLTYFLDSERVMASRNARMSFYCALPLNYFSSGYLFTKGFKFNATGDEFFISSFTDAVIYDSYIYGKAEVIFVN